MSGIKQIKDPIYGYIKIPDAYVSKIIDTAAFQRLRRLVQTSYSPLFPSSCHNRFAHSLGVYHFGKIAGGTLTKEIGSDNAVKDLADWKKINEVFLLSCLLHDVGHAPFSHTGEDFYLDDDKSYKALHDKLICLVKSNDFKKDVKDVPDSRSAAPHEIMSAIVGIQDFPDFFSSSLEKEFFARCITGYTFSKEDDIHRLYNCYIDLLHSEVIDVDRLDYLIRDAFFTGFDTVSIDYERLLSHITFTTDTEHPYEPAYYKGAVSVIENFIYAHDSERKWIQNHHSILYDMYIIKHVISQLDKKLSTDRKKLFSLESLRVAGLALDRGRLKVSLLCDDDIISLMKIYLSDDYGLSKEFFSRKDRRRTLWKTEADYSAFLLEKTTGGSILNSLEAALIETEKYVQKYTDEWTINDEIITRLEAEIKKTKTAIESMSIGGLTDVKQKSFQKQKSMQLQILKVMKCLQDYANSKGEPCDFVIIKADHFYSGFTKEEFSNIKIVFRYRDRKKTKKFEEVVTSLSGRDEPRENFFYIFCKHSAAEKFDMEEIASALIKAF